MLQFLQILLSRKDEKGASAVEYGLLVAGIAALIVVTVFALGGFVEGIFSQTCEDISGEGTITGTC